MSEQTAARSLPIAGTEWAQTRRETSRSDRPWVILRVLVDVAALLTAGLVTEARWGQLLGPGWHLTTAVMIVAATGAMGGYRRRLRLSLADELRSLVTGTSIASLLVTAVALLVLGHSGTGDATVGFWVAATVLLCGGRAGVHLGQRAARTRGQDVRRTLIVGAGRIGHLTARRLIDEPELGLLPVGFLDKEPLFDSPIGDREPVLPVLGASWDLERVLVEQRIDQVVVAFSTAPHHVLLGIVRTCWERDVDVMAVPRLYEVEGRRIDIEHLGAMPLVALTAAKPTGWQFKVKYALDRVIAGVLLLLMSPLLAVVAAAVLVVMGRPIFFRQRRVGRDGHEFEMVKFRTLRGTPRSDGELDAGWAAAILGEHGVTNARAAVAAAEAARATRLGTLLRRGSLDELPQLWNVVRGDMSLVGPRPERSHYVDRFRDAVYRYPERHRVKSGLTGWAQVHGLRGETSLSDRVEWDNFYIENWSFWLDLRIIAMTVPAVLRRHGAR